MTLPILKILEEWFRNRPMRSLSFIGWAFFVFEIRVGIRKSMTIIIFVFLEYFSVVDINFPNP